MNILVIGAGGREHASHGSWRSSTTSTRFTLRPETLGLPENQRSLT